MSSMPLAALDVRPIQQPEGPLDQYAKLQSLLGMQQQRQANSLAIQQQQQQLKNTQAMTAAMKDWDGHDYDALAKGVLANGGDANAALQIQQHGLQLRDTASQIASRDATTGQTIIDTIIKKH